MTLDSDGIVLFPALLSGTRLGECLFVAKEMFAHYHKDWIEGIENGLCSPTHFDIESARIPQGPVSAFAREIPDWLAETTGHHAWVDDVRLRITIPYPFTYVPWHRDNSGAPGKYLKLLVYLSDVPTGSGEFCHVCGSQLFPDEMLAQESEEIVARRSGYRRFPGRAGAGILFDSRSIHGATVNGSETPRTALIISMVNTRAGST